LKNQQKMKKVFFGLPKDSPYFQPELITKNGISCSNGEIVISEEFNILVHGSKEYEETGYTFPILNAFNKVLQSVEILQGVLSAKTNNSNCKSVKLLKRDGEYIDLSDSDLQDMIEENKEAYYRIAEQTERAAKEFNVKLLKLFLDKISK
jgi:hypothetical protein